jgi:hypothetical protein
MDISYVFVEGVVNTTFTQAVAASVAPQAVNVNSTDGMYVGATLMVGRGATREAVAITAVGTGTFTAIFAQSHVNGDPVLGGTFPTGETNNEFFTQGEVLGYLATAQNDYLLKVPLVYAITTQQFKSQQRVQPMPADAIQIQRVALNGRPLMESSETAWDVLTYKWNTTPANWPLFYFQDKAGFESYALGPSVPLNAFSVEVLYAQRDGIQLAVGDGFLLPDPFVPYVKYGAMAMMFNKDGEQRDPTRGKYCQNRFNMGVKIGNQFYGEAVKALQNA